MSWTDDVGVRRQGDAMTVAVDKDVYDVFISYAAASNELPAPFDSWVAKFVDSLRRTVRVLLGGRELRIYFDLRDIESNQPLIELLAVSRRSKVFVAITSPAYHARSWPRQEVEAFVAQQPDPRRLFIAELQPSPVHLHIEALRNRRMTLFHRQPSGPDSRELIPLAPASELFYERVMDLSASICAQLAQQDEAIDRSPVLAAATPLAQRLAAADETGTPVLLAQVTEDLDAERDSVRRYLEQFGYLVLPAEEYPQGGADFIEAFAQDLPRCKLVVQLLGPRPGRTPRDLPGGYTRHQAVAAASAGIALVQWRRMDMALDSVTDPAHRELLSAATVTASTLEQFKASVVAALKTKPRARSLKDPQEFLVFVNAEKVDRPAAQEIRKTLGANYSVVLPIDDSSSSVRDDLNENLRECDALLLVYGQAGPDWVRAQMRHLRKVRAGQPVQVGAVCYGPPADKPDVDFTVPGFGEVDCRTADGLGWSLQSVKELLGGKAS